ncbi:hypothetical protein DFP72DRAFT_1146761 [Ephemerocybe angulata]|uniref:Uncharacterized protein n=1 Tax=Ephemerocybe angulata TaxID=980116 RepID=A0A8H6M0W1_9AGAR|nr:hypothetical protein DFP72DRAFT_1146761 [Tulosesus angulatus]
MLTVASVPTHPLVVSFSVTSHNTRNIWLEETTLSPTIPAYGAIQLDLLTPRCFTLVAVVLAVEFVSAYEKHHHTFDPQSSLIRTPSFRAVAGRRRLRRNSSLGGPGTLVPARGRLQEECSSPIAVVKRRRDDWRAYVCFMLAAVEAEARSSSLAFWLGLRGVAQAGHRRRRAPGSVAGLVLVVVCGGEATPLSSGRSPDMRVIDRGESRYVCRRRRCGSALTVSCRRRGGIAVLANDHFRSHGAGGGEDHELVAAVGVGPGRRSRISAQGCRRCVQSAALGLFTSSRTWTRLLGFGYVVVVVGLWVLRVADGVGAVHVRAISLGSVVGHGYLFRIVVDAFGVVHPIRKSRASAFRLLNAEWYVG